MPEARGRRRRWARSCALLLSAAASALAGCGLLAPFDLAALSAPGQDGDGDADLDADEPRDADEPQDGDSRSDGDGPPWDPLAGCTEGETREQWLVVAAEGEAIRSYRTGRDCAGPERLCEGCVAAAFSPSGDRAVAFLPTPEHARVHDELLVIDLTVEGFPVVDGGFHGAQPAWVDDRTLAYVAAPASWRGSCFDDPLLISRPEAVDLRLRVVGTAEDRWIAGGLQLGWLRCCPVVSGDGRLLVIPVDHTLDCHHNAVSLAVVDLQTGMARDLPWTVEAGANVSEHPCGLLPGGGGLLVQRLIRHDTDESKLYATTFDGEAVAIPGTIIADARDYLAGDEVFGYWADCATARRLGPACEVTCRDPSDGLWYRRRLGQEGREPAPCESIAGEVRIMDVRQVPASD